MQHPDGLMLTLMLLFGGVILLALWRARHKLPYVRPIPGIVSIEEAVGRATELGRPVVFAMGEGDIRDIVTHASLSILEYIARLAARLRASFIAMVRKPDVYPFAENIVRDAYRSEGAAEDFRPEEQVRFLSDDGIVYAMSTARLIQEAPAGCALFFGGFFFTSLLMTEPGAQSGVLQIAGDPTLGQIPFFVCTCDYTIIGEEFFAAGAYVSSDPTVRGALVGQDFIKVVLALLVLVGTGALLLAGGAGEGPAYETARGLMKYVTQK